MTATPLWCIDETVEHGQIAAHHTTVTTCDAFNCAAATGDTHAKPI